VLICLQSLARHSYNVEGFSGPYFGKAEQSKPTGGRHHSVVVGGGLYGKAGGGFTKAEAADKQLAPSLAQYTKKSARTGAAVSLAQLEPSSAHQVDYPGTEEQQLLTWIGEVTGEQLLDSGGCMEFAGLADALRFLLLPPSFTSSRFSASPPHSFSPIHPASFSLCSGAMRSPPQVGRGALQSCEHDRTRLHHAHCE
jgi:hypothetical protein